MLFRVGLEEGDENRAMAWMLDHPGCFAYGSVGEAALAAAPGAIREYAAWIEAHGGSWLSLDEIELQLEETWQVYSIDEDHERVEQGYNVNAWFLHDWKPLAAEEITRGLQLLAWSRADLLDTLRGLAAGTLARRFPGERWDVAGIARHVANAEWWYLDRLGLAFTREGLPEELYARLDKARHRLVDVLPGLAGSRQVAGIDGEFWSPRKLLRRAAWHERDHTAHIRKLLG